MTTEPTRTIPPAQQRPAEAQAVKMESDRDPLHGPLLDSLLLVARIEGKLSTVTAVTAGLPLDEGRLTRDLFIRAANRAGLAALLVEREIAEVPRDVLPAVLLYDDESSAVLVDIDAEQGWGVLMAPGTRHREQRSLEQLQKGFSGHLFYLRPMQEFDARTPKIYNNPGEHWFWGVLKSSWHLYRDVLLASLFINLFVLAQPLFAMNVYDRVVPNNAIETLWALAIGVTLVYLFDLGLKILRGYMVELAAKRTDVMLSASLFERMLGIKMRQRPISVGSFVNRLHEFDSIRSFITSSTMLTLIDLPFLVLFLILIFYIGGWLVMVPLSVIPVALLLGYSAQRRLRPMIENVMRGASKKSANLVESMVGIETIKTLTAESRAQRIWEQAVGYVSQWGLSSRMVSNSTLMTVNFLQQLAMVAIVVGGVYLIADQKLTLGGLIACSILSSRALAPLGQLASLLTTYDHAEAALKSLDEIMELPVERPAGAEFLQEHEFTGALQFLNVEFAYPGQPRPSLTGLSIRVAAGEKIGIIGRVGSGKSTLARLALGLYDPERGSILYDGFDVKQLDPSSLRRAIGYVSQDVTLFYGSMRENISLGLTGIGDAEIVAAADKAGILGHINAHPEGLSMIVGERGETLSGGQRQALGLARMFLRDPPILVLDEPTSAMDQGSEARIKQLLAGFAKDKTLILTTHKMSMLDLVDRVLVLDQGRLVADGPKAQILEALRAGNIRGSA
jgi:ATP-binding cassette subfamily C protein LapB